MAIRLHLGRQQALIIQDFDTMATIVSQAFGSKKSKGSNATKAKSKAEMQQAMKGLFGG